MVKIDYKKELKQLYKASDKGAAIVEVPKMNYLMLDGEGDPNSSASFQDAIKLLYSLSYGLKFMIKKGEIGVDYGVMPLEGLWWADDMTTFGAGDKEGWKWTLMIMQPEIVTSSLVQKAIEQVKIDSAKVRFESLEEGRSAQILHVGPFSEEGATIEKLHLFIDENEAAKRGKHHEIYLSDMRRAAPDKWKTIIRQPIV